jgi:hypothetical protein
MIMFIFVITACTPAGNTMADPADSVMPSPTIEEAVSDEPVEVEPTHTTEPEGPDMVSSPTAEAEQEPPKDTPAWFDVPMVDVRTGQSFTINDHHGKVVMVETLAMWCSLCFKQQTEVKSLHERLVGDDRFVSIGLDIDVNEQAKDLKTYTETNQFDWLYAIAPVEVARDLSTLYGAQFLNPPSTPILVIDKGGEVHLMNFGIKTADELYDFIAPLLAQ